MKRLISIIAILTMCAAFTACNKVPEADKFEGLQFIPIESDGWEFDDLAPLEEYCDIAVVGEFTEDGVQDIGYVYNDYFKRDIVDDARSVATVKISRVLVGDISVGDEVKVKQRYGVVNNQLIAFSSLTPMQKGDEWVFFLKQDDDGMYWCCCDSGGRYPTKNVSNNRDMSLSEDSKLGVYYKADFNEKVYNELVEKYGI